MNRIDRMLWPLFGAGEAVYAMILIALALAEAAVCAAVDERGLWVLSAVVLAFLDFLVSDSRARFRYWQWACDAGVRERSRQPTVNMRVSRSDPSDWDDA